MPQLSIKEVFKKTVHKKCKQQKNKVYQISFYHYQVLVMKIRRMLTMQRSPFKRQNYLMLARLR